MIKRFTISLCSFALNLVGTDANAQCNTTPCSTPVAAYDALSACILSSEHDLDCYVGETIDSWPFSLPPYWCTSVENNQWFAFTASAANVSFDIYVDNCASGGALQAALLETSDCFNFNFVSDCLGNIPSGSTQTLSNNVPLIPGNVYYLMIDGSAGAKCQFAINASGITSGPQFVCTPDASTYFYTSNQVATWSIFPAGAGTIVSANPSQSV